MTQPYLLAPVQVQKFFDNNGVPLASGFVYTYQAGTTNPQASYPSPTSGSPNPNPIQLNARGEAAIWLDPGLSYKINLTDSQGNQIPGWPVDQIPGGPSSATAFTVGPAASGPSLTVNAAINWQSIQANGTLQVIGPSLSHANQVVTTTQLLLHGGFAEYVSIWGAGATDCKVWSFYAGNQGTDGYFWRTENDALNATFTFMQVLRSGTYNANQVTTQFLNGFGTITFSPTASNGYQATVNAGGVAGFANGLKVVGGSNSADNAITVLNYNATETFFNITGQGQITFGAATASGLVGLSIAGVASNASPVATFGGTNSNFITVTDGGGIVLVAQAGTGVSAGVVGPSSNHALLLQTNNTTRINIAAAGGVTLTKHQTSGFGTPTGNSVLTNFPGATATLAQCSAAIAQIYTDLIAFGLYGT